MQQKVKIFLASSAELKHEREQVELAINRINGEWHNEGIFLDLLIWEDGRYISTSLRSQDDYNREVRECDVFAMMFYSKVGKYTYEEFAIAKARFETGQRPRILIFQKNTSLPAGISKPDFDSRHDFLEELKKIERFPCLFENVEGLILELGRCLENLRTEGYFDAKPQLRGIKVIQSQAITFRDLDADRPLPSAPAALNYYFSRPSDRELDQALSDQSKRLVVAKGGPMAGKTRAIVEALHRQPNQQVLIPEVDQADHWMLPSGIKSQFLIFNDFDLICERVGKIRLNDFLAGCFKSGLRIVITCKTGPEYHILRDAIETRFWESAQEVEVKRLERREFERIEQHFQSNNIPIDRDAYRRLDYHIGSLFMDLYTMRQRYRKLQKDAFGLPQSILQTLKALYLGYNRLNDGSFSKNKVKIYRNLWSGKELPVGDWNRAFSLLAESGDGNGFIRWTKEGNIFIEEAYLRVVVNDLEDDQYYDEIEEVFPEPHERVEFGFFGTRYWTIRLNEENLFTRKDGESFLSDMAAAGVQPNEFTFTSLINKAADAEVARFWFDKMEAAGILPNEVTFTSLINKAADAEVARFWFDKMEAAGILPNEVTFTSLINKAADAEVARFWFDKMEAAGIIPDEVTFNSLINKAADAEVARFWFDKMEAAGILPNEVTFTSLINKAADAEVARFWFDKMEAAGILPNEVTFNSLINKAADAEVARFWFDKMEAAGILPNEVTFNSLINKAADAEVARFWFDKMEAAGILPNEVTFNSLINKAADAEVARFWFDKMEAAGIIPDEFTFTSLINKAADAEVARFWFDKMVQAGSKPNVFTISTLLKKCVRDCAGIAWVEGLREHHRIRSDAHYEDQLAKLKQRYRCG